jgi:hypothetical protein
MPEHRFPPPWSVDEADPELARHRVQPKCVVEFAIGQQSGSGGHHCAVGLISESRDTQRRSDDLQR